MAIWVFDHLPMREETNDRNDLAFALTISQGEVQGPLNESPNLSVLADAARQRADIWTDEVMEARAGVLRDIHADGKLAVWVFDHLPSEDESQARHELVRSLIALADIFEEAPLA